MAVVVVGDCVTEDVGVQLSDPVLPVRLCERRVALRLCLCASIVWSIANGQAAMRQ